MPEAVPVPFRTAFRFWLKLGFINFGGPAGQIAIMHRELVERRRWVSEERFLHALNYCMLLPGPEAMQLATYVGWLLHRAAGGIAAGVLFVLPSVFVLLGLSYLYAAHREVPWVEALFFGLKPAVLAIVAHAVARIGRRALQSRIQVAVAAGAFLGLAVLRLPFPLIILGAGVLGLAGSRLWPRGFLTGGAAADVHPHASDPARAGGFPPPLEIPDHTPPSRARSARVLAVCLALWIGPLLAIGTLEGWSGVHYQEAVFFSKAAMVTFGGAYAVLPYIAQAGVERYGWLSAGQMIDGLGLAETTPGPLIMVVLFVGFLGAWNAPGGLSPVLAGVLGGLTATYFTFLPCFLWIFLGAPYIERLRGNAQLRGALSAITAAVVGVMLNLAVFFGTHVLYPGGALDPFAAAVCAVVLLLLALVDLPVFLAVLGSAGAGLVYRAWTAL
jgi:chromate transporter